MKYHYIAVDTNQRKIKGVLEANSKNTAAKILLDQGLTPIKISSAKKFSLDALQEINVGGIPLKKKVFFFKQFALMVKAGLPISRVLEILGSDATYPPIQRIVQEAHHDIMAGRKLHEVFKGYPELFDSITIALIEAGEESGKLDYVLDKISKNLDKKHKISSSIKSALAYPTVVMIVVILVLVFLAIVVLPQLSSVFEDFNVTLPFTTRVLLYLSRIFVRYGIVILMLLPVLIVGLFYLRKIQTIKSTWDLILPKLPVIGTIYSKIQLTYITSTLSLLLSAGLPITHALELTINVTTNKWYKLELERMLAEIRKGKRLSETISEESFFPPLFKYMIQVGEETGKLDSSIAKIAHFYEKEVFYTLKDLSSVIQPIIILLLGIAIGFIVVSIYLPLSQLAQHIT